MPTRRARLIFGAKIALLRLRRGARDRRERLPRHSRTEESASRTLAEVRLPLVSDRAPEERRYERGKVQNVRVAASRLNGVNVPAGAVFSFWRQLGRCTRSRGFVTGRQLQEGCLIPSVGGGLCLLSNALYAAARGAGLEIVERHAHTRAVPGSLAERGEDATVAWNHIDLRLRSPTPWRLVVLLTTEELIVRIQGEGRRGVIPLPMAVSRTAPILHPEAHACGRCGQTSCARHLEIQPVLVTALTVALDLEPEFAGEPTWTLAAPPRGMRIVASRARLAGRRAWRREGTRASAELARAESWALAVARSIPYETERLRVDLRLLPWLWRSGALGGRSFEVLALRPSLETLQRTLDSMADRFPERRLLRDFRAPSALLDAEREALSGAERILTPHTAAATDFGARATLLEWNVPAPHPWSPGRTLLFPGPTHARKGAFEVREAARTLGLPVRTIGGELEGAEFWSECEWSRADVSVTMFENVLAVVQPALVEERPRCLLRALASGVPAVATKACGLPEAPGLILIDPGDAAALVTALRGLLDARG